MRGDRLEYLGELLLTLGAVLLALLLVLMSVVAWVAPPFPENILAGMGVTALTLTLIGFFMVMR